MLRNLIILVIVIVIGIGAALLFQKPTPVPPAPAVASAPTGPLAPDFTFTTLDNKTMKLSDLRGRVVLLNFWASWCAPCIVEFPAMLELAKDFKGSLIFLAVSVDHDNAAMKDFLTRQSLNPNTLVAWDKEKAIAHDLFQSIRYPETIIIGPQGEMVEKIAGYTDWVAPEMRERLNDLR
jgi:thiol-disulfide isomerase/thioredoxin